MKPSSTVLLSRPHPVADWLPVICLLVSVMGSTIVYGGSRFATAYPFLLLGCIGSLLVFLRPFFQKGHTRLLLPPATAIALVLLLFVGVQSFLFSKIPYLTHIEWVKLSALFFALLAWTEISARRTRWKFLLGLLILFGVGEAWYAVIQAVNGTSHVFLDVRPEQYGNRASGTFLCPNHFAQILSVLGIACLCLVFASGAGGLLRMIAGYGLLLMLPTLFLTGSRSGVLGFAVGAFISLILVSSQRGWKAMLSTFVLIPLVIGGAFFGFYKAFPEVQDRITEIPVDARLEYWTDTQSMIQDVPVVGNGGGTFEYLFPPYREAFKHPEQYIRHAHNEFLETITDYGWIGFGLVALLLAWLLFRSAQAIYRSEKPRDTVLASAIFGVTIATMVHNAFDFSLHNFANAACFVALIGILSGRLFVSKKFNPLVLKRTPMLALSATLVLGCIVTILAATRIFLAESAVLPVHAALEVEEIWQEGSTSNVLDRVDQLARPLERAERFYPGHGGLQRSSAELALYIANSTETPETYAAALDEAEIHFQKAIEANPFDAPAHAGLGIVYWMTGRDVECDASMQQAIDLDPRRLEYPVQWAVLCRDAGEPRKALEILYASEKYDLLQRGPFRETLKEIRDSIAPLTDPDKPVGL